MNIIEFFKGTANERAKLQRAQQLKAKYTLNTQQQKGVREGDLVSRRIFLRQLAGTVVILAAGSSGAAFLLTREEEDHRLELARKLQQWHFPNGKLVSDLFPEIQDYANLLTAPSLPQLRSAYPLRVYYADLPQDAPSGHFNMDQKFDRAREKDLAITVTTTTGERFTLPFIAETKPSIRLTSSIRGTNAEMVVLAKEVSQALDLIKYCRRYRQAQEKLGNKFKLVNNLEIPIDQDYIDFSIGGTQISSELEKTNKSWLLDFIDEGSFLRIGAILYANWERHFANERVRMPRNYINSGKNFAEPLKNNGVILLQDDYFKWAAGQAPDVSSDEFYFLWGTYGSRAQR